ncbi:MAG: class I SAM-dependent methyltransferase [Clostridia bacterium]|nr:class I SAM-dependent methyltransferase [Clostridia bacterium]
MNNLEKFFQNTKDLLPHKNVQMFCEDNMQIGTAIDFGCGAGKDTIVLLKNGWDVISIDKENTKALIEQNLTEEEKKHLKFIQSKFEDCRIEKNDLFVANFSIPFCKKECFEQLWNNIVNSIKENRIFYRKLLWI